jgi:hypothetical protein
MGEGEVQTTFLVGNPEEKRQLGRPRRRGEDNTKMNLQEIGCGCMDWIDVPQNGDGWRTFVNVGMECSTELVS